MRFFLGTHEPHWLGLSDVPLFVSHRRLAKRKRFPRSAGSWALDSGAFTELQKFGEWTISPAEYVAAVRRYTQEIGAPVFVSPMDWMCEPIVIAGGQAGPIRFAGTHLSVREHQRRTIANYLELRMLAPELPIIPVVQGWVLDDYLRIVDDYDAAGIDLTRERVGLGSVCRRQATAEIGAIVGTLAGLGLNLHGFGVKKPGLARYGADLASADSMSWSYDARHDPRLPGCTHPGNCANCLTYALRWREGVLKATASQQLALPLGAARNDAA